MDSYKNRALHNIGRFREHTTPKEDEVKKMRRRIYDSVNKCKDLGVLENALNILKRGSANGSARDS